jgi:hypothetical protein
LRSKIPSERQRVLAKQKGLLKVKVMPLRERDGDSSNAAQEHVV